MNRRERFWQAMDHEEDAPPRVRRLHLFLVVLILANILAVVLDSVPAIRARHAAFFHAFENFSVSVFLVEYLLRFWSCTADPRFRHPVWGRIRFALTPMALVDLLSILPSLLVFLPLDLRFLRSLRILRMARVGKLGRYSEAAALLGRVFKTSREELWVSLALLSSFALVCASLMYIVEGQAQPENFPHIPAAMWWAFVTITTVGYGDVYPITPLGRVLGVATTLIGILMVALPAGIFVTSFLEELNKTKAPSNVRGACPHCGKALDGDGAPGEG